MFWILDFYDNILFLMKELKLFIFHFHESEEDQALKDKLDLLVERLQDITAQCRNTELSKNALNALKEGVDFVISENPFF